MCWLHCTDKPEAARHEAVSYPPGGSQGAVSSPPGAPQEAVPFPPGGPQEAVPPPSGASQRTVPSPAGAKGMLSVLSFILMVCVIKSCSGLNAAGLSTQ